MVTLHLEAVSKEYDTEVPTLALHDTTLTIRQGEFIAIEGPSGSGKSTLLNLLALLDSPTSGEVRVDGVATKALDEAAKARLRSATFAFIFQSFHLMNNRNLKDNVSLGNLYKGLIEDRRVQLADKSLEAVGLGNKTERKASQLSGGERQRVAIARAIASSAPVVVADEPTGNLDSKTSNAVMDVLEKLNEAGSTVIVVTHDPSVAARADRRIRVLDGVVSDAAASRQPTQAPVPEGRPSVQRPLDAFIDACRSLLSTPRRTVALIGAVTLGVALTVTTLSLSQTASHQVSDVFDATRNQRVALTSPLLESTGTGNPELIVDGVTSADALDRLRALSGVEAASVLISHGPIDLSTSASSANKVEGQDLVGVVNGEVLPELMGVEFDGRLPTAQLQIGPGEIIVGATIAEKMGLGPLIAGPVVWVNGQPHQVIGILTDAGLQNQLLDAVITSEPSAAAMSSTINYATAALWVAPGASKQVAEQAPVAWLPSEPEKIAVDAPPDPTTLRDQIETSVSTVLVTLTGVALLAAILSLASSMTNAVRQRIGEFGLRRAVGARRRHIVGLVMTESVLIGLVGGVLGIYTSTLAVLIITVARHWQPVLDPLVVPIGIGGGMVVGAIGGAVAARSASKIEPSDALRQ